MKVCNGCGEDKQLDSFPVRTKSPLSYKATCKTCMYLRCKLKLESSPELRLAKAEYKKQWAKRNGDRLKARRAEYHVANKKVIIARVARWAKDNPDKVRVYKQKWKDLNPDAMYAYRVKRRRAKAEARPIWADSEWESFVMQEMYALRRLRQEVTGMEWHVDHKVPLLSDQVCGLHCVANLEVVPASYNLNKSNTTWEYKW